MLYDEVETRILSTDALRPLRNQLHSLPRLAVVGEFSSGKSTLLNLLLGQDILPIKATATASPAIWLSHGEEEGVYIDAGGNRQALPTGGIADVPSDSRYIRLWSSADFLQSCDVLDLSGLADPGRTDDQTYDLLAHADCVIWCTPATQAWRQSERAAWLAVPERLRARSILAVTRIDKLRHTEELARVMRRVAHEAEGLFSAFVPISALLAQKALANDDEAVWAQSGIDALTEALFNLLQALGEGGDKSLDRDQVGQGDSAPANDHPVMEETPAEAAAEFPVIRGKISPDAEEPNLLNALAEKGGISAPLDSPNNDRAKGEKVLILTDAAFAESPSDAEFPKAEGSTHPPTAPQEERPAPLILFSPEKPIEISPEYSEKIEQKIAVELATTAHLAGRTAPEKTTEFDISAFTQQLMAVEEDPLYDGDLPAQPAPRTPAASAAREQLSPKPDQPIDLVEAAATAPQPAPPLPLTEATGAAMIPGIEAALQRVLAGYFGAKPPGSDTPAEPQDRGPETSSDTPPQEVLIWREIAARTEGTEPLQPIVSMIDELLNRLFAPNQPRQPLSADQARAPDLP